MTAPAPPPGREEFVSRALEATIRVGVVLALAAWCFEIVRPFLGPVVWGVIIAVATRSFYRRLEAALGGRRGPAALLFGLVAFVLVIGPSVALAGTLVEGVGMLVETLGDGSWSIPPPPPGVASWPLLGPPLDRFWSLASTNLQEALATLEAPIKAVATWLASKAAGAAAGAGMGAVQFALALVIAAVLQANAAVGQQVVYGIARRLAGERGPALADLSEATVRSVTRGILGVALIQSLAAGVGLLAAGVPAAGLWALLVLLAAVVQLPVLLVLLPIAAYVFTSASTVTAVAFLAWSVAVGLADNVLKPILLGRGSAVPMPVIFIGALGGFITTGIIGLFVGAIVLSVGYKLFLVWLETAEAAET